MKQKYHILVVDDDKEDHLILNEYFTDAGIEDVVYFVENGLQALDYLAGIKEDQLLPQLIILDLNMPILNGTQTLLQIKQTVRLRHIPVIIFSTSENETEKRKCLSFGAVDYLVKPLTFDEGLAMVKKFTSFVTS